MLYVPGFYRKTTPFFFPTKFLNKENKLFPYITKQKSLGKVFYYLYQNAEGLQNFTTHSDIEVTTIKTNRN